MNKKTRQSIDEGHRMWWEYREADPFVRTDRSGFCLVAITAIAENGGHRTRVNYRTADFDKAMALHEELSEHIREIRPPCRNMMTGVR